jgi:uroporphyrinogen III methyltransferase/synthase
VSNTTLLRLGTRGSMLARMQSQRIADEIESRHPTVKVELIIRKTTGDIIQDRPLHEAGGKGLFVKELELALLANEIDFAVHSLKDVPVTMPLVDQAELVIAAYPKREDPRDVLVSRIAKTIAELPQGARVGTGSLRRMAQLLHLRPDLKIEGLRGNIDTRIRKCLDGEYEAIILAMAGVRRSGLFDDSTMTAIPVDELVPSAGQGALALQCRANDAATRELLENLNDHDTALCVRTERAVVLALQGDCASPIGALAQVNSCRIEVTAVVAAAGGKLPVITAKADAPVDRSQRALDELIASLLKQGANNLLHPSTATGTVYLVGAGSGDPGLLTVRGMELLQQANVVVYDALANPQLLKHCPQAHPIYVGKRAAQHSMTQDQINAVLVEQGKKPGNRVVRLKGGDPFVFGRGGEECEALFDAGIKFEVVPGITAAIAAPAYAGIPVTHRDLNSSFTFLTGHEKEEEYKDEQAKARRAGAGSDVDWKSIARLPCIAFYMGVKSLPRISSSLINHGMDPQTPAATIQWGTHPRQRTIVGTVATLPTLVIEAKITPPAMTIIGQVVKLREKLNWFETRPLFGQTIIVTRTRDQASELSQQLTDLGANVLEAPTIELAPIDDPTLVSTPLKDGPWDWIIFTSKNGVSSTKEKLFEAGLDVRAFGSAKIAVVGEATAAAVRDELGLKVDLCPKEFVAEALADSLAATNGIHGKRFLLFRAEIARTVLIERLTAAGASAVRDVAIYQTKSPTSLPLEVTEAIANNAVHWITFTSSSTAKNFTALLGPDYQNQLRGIQLASIGPITTEALKALGLSAAVQADPHTMPGLVTAVKNAIRP